MPISHHRKLSPEKALQLRNDRHESRVIRMKDRLSDIHAIGTSRPLNRREVRESLALMHRLNRAKKNGWL